MRKYGKWALTLGLLAAMPGLTFAAGEATSPRSAGQSGAASPNQAKAEEIAKALKAAGVKGKGIELEYQNGVVVIGGQVSDAAMRTTAERTIKRVPGVSSVSNQLSVATSTAAAATRSTERLGGVVQAGATERAGDRRGQIQKVNYGMDNQAVAEQIGGALGAAGLEGYDIEVRFSNGVCTLAGEVDSPAQAAQAQRLVSQVPGVEQVSNRLRVPGMRPGMQPGMPGQQPGAPTATPPCRPAIRGRAELRCRWDRACPLLPATVIRALDLRRRCTTSRICRNMPGRLTPSIPTTLRSTTRRSTARVRSRTWGRSTRTRRFRWAGATPPFAGTTVSGTCSSISGPTSGGGL